MGEIELLELAERVEKLSGPCEAVDLEIARIQRVVCLRRNAEGTANEEFTHWRYTASIDSAMTLVPEGWTFANLSQSDSKGWWCELRKGFLTSYDKTAFGQQLNNANPALALTAAALRARLQQGEGG